MSKLLLRSKSRLVSAKADLLRVADDDAALDGACFQLHQSLEFALKAAFEAAGMRYPYGHDIVALLKNAESVGILTKEMLAFKRDADMYTKWETESRYTESFLATVSDANLCVARLEALHASMEDSVQSNNTVDDTIYRWCYENAPAATKELPRQEMLDQMLPLYQKFHKI